jgi:DNA-binding XRE family transcriptional regulator
VIWAASRCGRPTSLGTQSGRRFGRPIRPRTANSHVNRPSSVRSITLPKKLHGAAGQYVEPRTPEMNDQRAVATIANVWNQCGGSSSTSAQRIPPVGRGEAQAGLIGGRLQRSSSGWCASGAPEGNRLKMGRAIIALIDMSPPARPAKRPALAQERVKTRAAELIAEELLLQELRKAMRLTQAKLAKRLSLGQDTISRAEQRADMLPSTLQSYACPREGGGRGGGRATRPRRRTPEPPARADQGLPHARRRERGARQARPRSTRPACYGLTLIGGVVSIRLFRPSPPTCGPMLRAPPRHGQAASAPAWFPAASRRCADC